MQFSWVLCVFATGLFAQSPPVALSGQVQDKGGAAIPSATISLKAPTLRSPRLVESDASGNYVVPNLVPGRYEVEVLKPGFQIFSRSLDLAQSQTINFTLEVLPVSTTMTVEATLGKSTATRMDLPLRETPVAMTTITPQTLAEQGANDLVSALRNVSGMIGSVWYGTYEYYTTRGFVIDSVQLTDGMRNEGNRMNTQLVNVEEVQVLKGPASVLYGGDALGGAINIVRKKPQATRMFDFLGSYGRWQNWRLGYGSSGKVFGNEKLVYRFDTGFNDSDGYRGAGARRLNISPALNWLPNSRNRFLAQYSFNRDNFDTDAGVPNAALANGAPLDRRFNPPYDFALSHDHNFLGQYNWNISETFEFRNTFTYRWFNDQYYSAEGLGYISPSTITREYLYFKHHRRPILNQADVIGRVRFLGMEHRFLAGYEYQRFLNWTDRSAASSVATTPIDWRTFAETASPRSTFPLSRIDYFNNEINAIFYQDHITIHRKLKAMIGGRNDFFRRWSRNDPVVNGTQGVGPRIERQIDAWTYRAGLVYSPLDWMQFWGSHATSFRPNLQVPLDGSNLDPERGRMWEAGQRMEFFNRRLTTQTAFYELKKSNLVYQVRPQVFDLAGQQSSRGIEFDATGNLPRGFFVQTGYGYTMARFDNFFSTNLGTNLTGRIPRFAPKHTLSTWITKQFANGLAISGGNRYVSSLFAENFNRTRLGGYTTWDLAVFYRRGIAEYSMNAMNLFNKERYFVGAINDTQVYPGTPLNVFGTVRLRFK